jgi:hypothetical protein
MILILVLALCAIVASLAGVDALRKWSAERGRKKNDF